LHHSKYSLNEIIPFQKPIKRLTIISSISFSSLLKWLHTKLHLNYSKALKLPNHLPIEIGCWSSMGKGLKTKYYFLFSL
jgi:hypothetical protein